MRKLAEDHLAAYEPTAAGGFRPERVVLTRGALDTPPRRAFVERLLALFPDAERIEALDRTHMQLSGLLPGSLSENPRGTATPAILAAGEEHGGSDATESIIDDARQGLRPEDAASLRVAAAAGRLPRCGSSAMRSVASPASPRLASAPLAPATQPVCILRQAPRGDTARREAGRRTLVVGTIATPLRQSRESGIVCPNYLHVSPTAYCSYACAYCYLAGSCSTVVAPVVKIFVNLDALLVAVARRALRLAEPASFYIGKLQDALALDPLTGCSRVLVPFFAAEPLARLVLLTKSDCVENLLALDPGSHSAVSWSVNPEAVCRDFEAGAPPLARRLDAARRCHEAGYPVRFLIMPILPVDGWRQHYAELVEAIFAATRPQRITLGGICSYGTALRLTAAALGRDNLIARHIARAPSPDGRRRFPRELRTELYRHILGEIRRHAPGLPVALCLEEPELWEACGLDPARPTCNCVW